MRHTIISRQDSIDIIINKLKKREIFTFVRYGDGDYMMMYNGSIGAVIGRGNRFLVTKEFQKELIDSYNIEDCNYLIGTSINDHSRLSTFRNIKENRLPLLQQRNKMLIVGCIMDTMMEDIEKFKEFTKEMCKTSTMFVCNYNHSNLEKAYGEIKVFVKVPRQNSYSTIDVWYREILRNLGKVDKIVMSAGQFTRIVAKRLWETSKDITVIDVGSVSDMLIINTDIINTIPQRGHLRLCEKQIIRSLSELLGYRVTSKLPQGGMKHKRRHIIRR